MLGINELGHRNDQGYQDEFRALIEQVQLLLPDAQIYIQSIIPVNAEVCLRTKQPAYITNEQIAIYNELLREVALEKEVYYLEVQEAMVDESGQLPADASADGIHFRKDGYSTWYEYLKNHTVEAYK